MTVPDLVTEVGGVEEAGALEGGTELALVHLCRAEGEALTGPRALSCFFKR